MVLVLVLVLVPVLVLVLVLVLRGNIGGALGQMTQECWYSSR